MLSLAQLSPSLFILFINFFIICQKCNENLNCSTFLGKKYVILWTLNSPKIHLRTKSNFFSYLTSSFLQKVLFPILRLPETLLTFSPSVVLSAVGQVLHRKPNWRVHWHTFLMFKNIIMDIRAHNTWWQLMIFQLSTLVYIRQDIWTLLGHILYWKTVYFKTITESRNPAIIIFCCELIQAGFNDMFSRFFLIIWLIRKYINLKK